MNPTTFKEQLRLLYSRFLVGAGVAIGVGVVGLILLLAFGGWPEDRYAQIIDILGWLAIGSGASMMLVIVFLGLGGPAHLLKVALGKLSIETQGDDE